MTLASTILKYVHVIIGLLLNAVNLVLKDGRFDLPSTSVTTAPSHAIMFNRFAVYLSTKLKLCFITINKTKHLKQAKMWGDYHKLRTSSSFKAEWQKFLDNAVKQQPSVAFYQFVTHKVFKELIKMEFSVSVHAEKIKHWSH